MFKHFHSYDKSTLAPSFKPNPRVSRKHKFQLFNPPSKDGENGVQTNFFFQRTTKIWNNLSSLVVNAKDVNQFKNRLDEIWISNPSKFDHKATDEDDE